MLGKQNKMNNRSYFQVAPWAMHLPYNGQEDALKSDIIDIANHKDAKIKYVLQIVDDELDYVFHDVHEESIDAVVKYIEDQKCEFANICEKIRYRYTSMFLSDFVKRHKFYYFTPQHPPTWDYDENSHIIEICYYHMSKLHNNLFRKTHNGEIIIHGPIVGRAELEELYIYHFLEPPFEMRFHTKNQS